MFRPIPARRGRKTGKIEKSLLMVKAPNQHAGGDSAEKAGQNPDNQRCRSQRHTVQNQLRIEQNRTHHKGRQPIVLHTALGEGSGQWNGSVHTQRGRDTQGTGGGDAQHTQPLSVHSAEQAVDMILRKNRDNRTEYHA